jgi:hypothetical protein
MVRSTWINHFIICVLIGLIIKITAAYNFKTQTGADYADFTDKFDDYVRMERLLSEAISYLEDIMRAIKKSSES